MISRRSKKYYRMSSGVERIVFQVEEVDAIGCYDV